MAAWMTERIKITSVLDKINKAVLKRLITVVVWFVILCFFTCCLEWRVSKGD